jgi:hypothetical protein
MDLATIPFDVENPTAFYAAPNKLWEYLSQGAVVAATPIPEVLAYQHLGRVYIVKNPEGYVKAFEEAGGCRSRDIDPRVREVIKARLWSSSVEKLKKIFKSLAQTK